MSRAYAEAGSPVREAKNTLTLFVQRVQQHNEDLRVLLARLDDKASALFGADKPTAIGKGGPQVEPILPVLPQLEKLFQEQSNLIDELRSNVNRLSDL